jgi:hypothetical protein
MKPRAKRQIKNICLKIQKFSALLVKRHTPQWVTRYPAQVIVTLASTLAIVIIAILLSGDVGVRHFTTSVHVGGSGDVIINKVDVTIDKFARTLEIDLSFENPSQGIIAMRVAPDSFDYLEGKSIRVGVDFVETYRRDGARWFIFKNVNGNGLLAKFKGDVFPQTGREFVGYFYFSANAKRASPSQLRLVGIDQISFRSITPEPTYSAEWAKTISLGQGRAAEGTVELRGEDREVNYNRDLRVLLYGIFIGIFSSIIASVILNVATFYEERRARTKQPGSAS